METEKRFGLNRRIADADSADAAQNAGDEQISGEVIARLQQHPHRGNRSNEAIADEDDYPRNLAADPNSAGTLVN